MVCVSASDRDLEIYFSNGRLFLNFSSSTFEDSFSVGAPTGYLKTGPGRGANQYNSQSNDRKHKTGESSSPAGELEKNERGLEQAQNQDCTAAARV